MVCAGPSARRCSHGQPGQNDFLIRSKPFLQYYCAHTAVLALQYPESDVLSFALACGTLINMYDAVSSLKYTWEEAEKSTSGWVRYQETSVRSFCSWLIHQTAMQLEAILRRIKNIFCLLPVDPFDSLWIPHEY